jgi:hypothetical protein
LYQDPVGQALPRRVQGGVGLVTGKPQKNRGKAIDKGAKRGIIRVTDNMAYHVTESVKR